jgi:PIN domain nuclease of toxin-antitoxin system
VPGTDQTPRLIGSWHPFGAPFGAEASDRFLAPFAAWHPFGPLIVDPANEVFLSPAPYWEIAIKVSMGKRTLHQPQEDLIDLCLNRYEFVVLPIEPLPAARVATLPFPPDHQDPFDRLIVAQARVESMSVVSADPKPDTYGINRLWLLTGAKSGQATFPGREVACPLFTFGTLSL